MNYTTSERASIATTIANQLTRSEKGIRVLAMMIGAKNFISLDAGLQFQFAKFSGCKSNYCSIELLPDDTYHMRLYSIRSAAIKSHYDESGLYCDQIGEIFQRETGLVLGVPRVIGINA